MEPFRDLKGNQVALIRCQFATGHVLDESLSPAMSANQKMYTIFSSVGEALTYAKDIIKDRNDVECVIYDKDKKVVQYLNCENTH